MDVMPRSCRSLRVQVAKPCDVGNQRSVDVHADHPLGGVGSGTSCLTAQGKQGARTHDFSGGGLESPADTCTTAAMAANKAEPSHQFHAMAAPLPLRRPCSACGT